MKSQREILFGIDAFFEYFYGILGRGDRPLLTPHLIVRADFTSDCSHSVETGARWAGEHA